MLTPDQGDPAMRPIRLLVLTCLAGVAACCSSWPLPAQAESPSDARMQQLINQVVRELVPHRYVDEDDWGKTEVMTTGLRVTRDGWRLSTKRRKKEVNHGHWKRYEIRLVDPDQQFRLQVDNFQRLPDEGMSFDANLQARLKLHGRVSRWRRGVQMFSLSADAESVVQLKLKCEVDVDINVKQFPPAFVLQPVVTAADMHIADFRLNRISDLDGPLVRELGDQLHDVLNRQLDQRREKLVHKINRQIEKNQDDLTLELRF